MGKNYVLCCIALFILTACSSTSEPKQTKQSAADVSVALSKQVVTPKKEPPSRTGNPQAYKVFGKRYTVSGTSEGYRRQGTASWYGRKFHGRKTSSGVPYNMYAMTAAHKSLPIPTYVRVTHLGNGRSIVVKVNDRGPFVHGRIIDLSYAAATKLGMVKSGTAPVEVTALSPYQYLARHPGVKPKIEPGPPEERLQLASLSSAPTLMDTAEARNVTRQTAPPRAFAISKPKSFYLQVGAFSQRDNAERLQTRLADSLDQTIRIDTGAGAMYKVQIGPLNDYTQADLLSVRLAALGIENPRPVFD